MCFPSCNHCFWETALADIRLSQSRQQVQRLQLIHCRPCGIDLKDALVFLYIYILHYTHQIAQPGALGLGQVIVTMSCSSSLAISDTVHDNSQLVAGWWLVDSLVFINDWFVEYYVSQGLKPTTSCSWEQATTQQDVPAAIAGAHLQRY